jgi:hypothetical protein
LEAFGRATTGRRGPSFSASRPISTPLAIAKSGSFTSLGTTTRPDWFTNADQELNFLGTVGGRLGNTITLAVGLWDRRLRVWRSQRRYHRNFVNARLNYCHLSELLRQPWVVPDVDTYLADYAERVLCLRRNTGSRVAASPPPTPSSFVHHAGWSYDARHPTVGVAVSDSGRKQRFVDWQLNCFRDDQSCRVASPTRRNEVSGGRR